MTHHLYNLQTIVWTHAVYLWLFYNIRSDFKSWDKSSMYV